MAAFVWSDHYLTGLDDIDRQHRRLVDLINGLGDLLSNGCRAESVEMMRALEELEDYARAHFVVEESMMLRFDVADAFLEQHGADHERFFDDLSGLRNRANRGDSGAGPGLMNYLVHWLAHHILGTDLYMAHQIRQIQDGCTPEQAFENGPNVNRVALDAMLGALNALFLQVSERNRELEHLNGTLEARVRERTRALHAANRKLVALAHTDPLTGLPNRRHAVQRLSEEWRCSSRADVPLSALMVDLDGFKQINDGLGHEMGDRVLKGLGRAMSETVRTDDIVCRLGGDEFLVVCPCTTMTDAVAVAESLRKSVSRANGAAWKSTLSIGVASRNSSMKGWRDLLRAADGAVYHAKAAGRDCVRVAT